MDGHSPKACTEQCLCHLLSLGPLAHKAQHITIINEAREALTQPRQLGRIVCTAWRSTASGTAYNRLYYAERDTSGERQIVDAVLCD
jgi:hypothetical protein